MIPHQQYERQQLERMSNKQREEVWDKISEQLEQNKGYDLFHKAFLRPIQIALKTYQTEREPSKMGCLPYGIKQVVKTNIEDNKYDLINFYSFKTLDQPITYQRSFQQNYNNLISLMKKPPGSNQGIKIAICICMYSEDKGMLKRTIAGVSKNIATFVQNGVPSHEIAVFVIIDGIQVVDETVINFFEELQKQNGIYLSDDVEPWRPHDLIEQQQLDDDEVRNINHFIFNPIQFEDRQKRRFETRKKQYKEVKEMIIKIEKTQRERNIIYHSLDDFVKSFFIRKAREKHKKDYAEDQLQSKAHPDQFFVEKYAENISNSQPLILESLNEAKRHCIEYLRTRDELALLHPYRMEILLAQASSTKRSKQRGSEYTEIDDNGDLVINTTKMNLFMVTKYKNRGKLSSHNWFFNGFCQQLDPKYAFLLDVGLTPEDDALYKMYEHMENNGNTGGVCGYMGLKIERMGDNEEVARDNIDCITSLCMKFFDIQRAQQMEYHFAHLVDKPFEAFFKFIHVLPGAFSGYRMEALRPKDKKDSKLMQQYFKSIEQTVRSTRIQTVSYSSIQTIFRVILPDMLFFCLFTVELSQNSDQQLMYNENVYLAEDRTLCMGIHQNGYDLYYLPDAYAWVDPMKTLYALLGQRKRWINGSFFAFAAVQKALNQKCSFLNLQVFYLEFMNKLAFVAPALFLFTIHIAMYAFQADVLVVVLRDFFKIADASRNQIVNIFVYAIDFIYIMMFLALIFFSMHLTHRNPKFMPYFYATSTVYGLFAIVVFIVLLVDIIAGLLGRNTFLQQNPELVGQIPGGVTTLQVLRYLIISIFGLYIIPVVLIPIAFCRCDFIIDIVLSTPAFLFYGPTYLNILNVYALCRIDDISWGTKGLDTEVGGRSKELKDNWKAIKMIHVAKFVFWNCVVGFVLLALGNEYVLRFFVTFAIMGIIAFTLVLKMILGIFYIIKYKGKSCCSQKHNILRERVTDQQIQSLFKPIKESLKQDVRASVIQLQKQCAKIDKDLKKIMLGNLSFIRKINQAPNRKKKFIQNWQKSTIMQGSKIVRAPGSINTNQIKRAEKMTPANAQDSAIDLQIQKQKSSGHIKLEMVSPKKNQGHQKKFKKKQRII